MGNIKKRPIIMLFLVGVSQICFSQQNQVVAKTDSIKVLQQSLNETNLSDDEIVHYLEIAQTLQGIAVKEPMATFLEKIEDSIDLKKQNRISFMYFLLKSRNLLFHHKYKESITLGNKAIEIKSFGTSEESIYILSTIGTCHYYKSAYEEALRFHFEALQICGNIEEGNCRSGIYNNISVVYLGTRDLDKAQEYTSKAIQLSETNKNDFEQSRAVGNMAIIYAEKGQFKKSEEWFKKDLELDLLKGDSLSVARNYNNLGRLNEIQRQYKKALEYYIIGLEFATLQKDVTSIAIGYQNVGWMQHKNGNNSKALENFELGMKMSKDLGNRDILRDALLNISEFYEELNNPIAALNYFKKYHDLNDSLIGQQKITAISELEIKYETEKKENEILKLSADQMESEATIAEQERKLQQLSFGLALMSIIGILTFFLYKQRLQNKKQNELILAISETQIAERKRISQDLHDSIGGSLALTKSKLMNALSKLKETPLEMDEAILALNSTSNQVRQISHNLMPGELVRFGLIPAINTLLEQLNKEELHAQLYATQMDERLKPIKEIQLYRIIQEAIQNVLKHAKAKNLYIHLNKHKQHLSLLIEDDGIGILPNIKEGLGFKNMEQRVKMLNGSFTLDSSENKGTTLNIQIPI